jgi:hypothetical protein
VRLACGAQSRSQALAERRAPAIKKLNRRSCALVGTSPAISGVTSNDASPAAAAHASRWPMFALSDVHCATFCSTREPREDNG